MAARLSIMRAARQLAVEAGVHIYVRNFQTINQVGAASIDARLDCDAMASTHSATSHYDRQSFVGLAWRPHKEPICCEIYSTGKANLPGSTRERELLCSFARMLGELIRHSNRPDVLTLIQPHLIDAHRPRAVLRDDATAADDEARQFKKQKLIGMSCSTLWDDTDMELSQNAMISDFLLSSDNFDADAALLDGAGF